MDAGELWTRLPFVIAIIVLVLLQFVFRRRRGGRKERTPPEVVQSLLNEVKLNLTLIETSLSRQQVKRFKTDSWKRNKTKLDFLDQSLQTTLFNAFGIAEDFNQQIDAAKRHKSTIYPSDINVDRLGKPLTKSKEGLEEWLQENIGSKELPPRYPGVFDDFFGGR